MKLGDTHFGYGNLPVGTEARHIEGDAETVRRFASRYRQVCEATWDRAYDEARERELERKE